MDIVNDSMLALILRFIGDKRDASIYDHTFIQNQLNEIQEHVKQFLPREQESRALKWIEKYAEEYRKEWEEKIITDEFANQRCPDCPLNDSGKHTHCSIHDQWLELLNKHIAGDINSKEYVVNALKLLSENKEDLKVKRSMLSQDEITE